MLNRIPKSFTVGGQDMYVFIVDTIPNDKMGECTLWNGNISIARTYKGFPQTQSSQYNTFFHELTHAVLDTMGEYELSQNERFVCTFASLLTEAVRSFKYEEYGE